MLAKKVLPSSQVFNVSDDSCVLIRVQKMAQSFIITTISQNVQRYPVLLLVWWHFDVLFFKKQSELLLGDFENMLVRQSIVRLHVDI